MGGILSEDRGPLAALKFKKHDGTYRGSVPLADLALLPNDPAETMHTVAEIYRHSLMEIHQWQRETQAMHQSKKPITARRAWQLGDIVYRLEADLKLHSCRLVDLYDHLARHAGTTDWLGTFRTFRRYVEDPEAIPEKLLWNSIAKRPKAVGQAITDGQPVEG